MRISDEQAQAALIRQHFSFYLQKAFAELGGGRNFKHNWHVDAIEHELDRIRLGDNRRLIVSIPPRHLKSIMITTAWVAWMLGKDPSLRFICASYGQDLSDKHARDCLKIMSSDWYQRAFPNVRLTKRNVSDFETSAGGGRLSTSVGGVITGRGADIVIIDDPMKADDALSEVRRQDVLEWFDTALMSRLDDQATSSIVLVMQRLHEADLAGELLRRGTWNELRLSAIATKDELIPLTRGRFHQRREGYPLHAARWPIDALLEKKKEEPYVFAAQWQQDPVSRVGAFVQAKWFGQYDEPPVTGTVTQSWDTANKTTVRSDWSVGITARYYMNRWYILDVFRKRVEFGELMSSLCAACREHRVDRLLIEDASSGQALIHQIRYDAPDGVVYPIPITPTADKIARFEAIASRIENGSVVLPRTAPWLADFVAELVRFPGGSHDDQADALAQLIANPPSTPTILNAAPELMDPDGGGEYFDPDDDPWL